MANDTGDKRPAQAAHEQRKTAAQRDAEERQRKTDDAIKAAAAARQRLRDVNIANPGGTSSTVYTPPFAERAPAPPEPDFAPLEGEPSHESGRGSATGSSAPGWHWFTPEDAFVERPPVTWFVDGVFAEGSLNMVFGAPGTLKTMLMLDALVCIALGKPWLTNRDDEGGIATIQSPVVFVDFDNGKRRAHERIEALLRGHGVTDPKGVPVFYTSMPRPFLIASKRGTVEILERFMLERGVKACVIDNLTTISGGVDLNSSEMSPVMMGLRELVENTGAAIAPIHHERKGSGKKGGGNRPGEAALGHTSINAALDSSLMAERDNGSNLVTVNNVKSRDYGLTGFAAEFGFEHRAGTREMRWGRFYGRGLSEDMTSDGAVRQCILNNLAIPKTQTAIVADVRAVLPKAGEKRIRRFASAMVEEGLLVATAGDKNARIYQRAA